MHDLCRADCFVKLVPPGGILMGHKKAQKAQRHTVGISGTLEPFEPLCGQILLIESWLRRRRAVNPALAVLFLW
jgi:hypothetical protein